MTAKHYLRLIARKLGVGKAIVAFYDLRATGIRQRGRVLVAKSTYLHRILDAKPIATDGLGPEVHMVLNHKRHLEGIWALYSLLFFSGKCYRIVIHSDGTLTDEDCVQIQSVFPGCRVIARDVADVAVIARLEAEKLPYCAALRRSFIFSIQLFDPILLSEAGDKILLDADVLFFAPPHELVADVSEGEVAHSRYSVDNGNRYPLPPAELTALIGRECVQKLNSGLVRFPSAALDLQRIESYLHHPGLMIDGQATSYYTEQTIFALELTLDDAQPLPATYAICAPEPTTFVAGHYCGGGYWASLFYTRGLPYLAAILLA